MPSLKLRLPLRRREGALTLRERAAALKATAARVIRRKVAVAADPPAVLADGPDTELLRLEREMMQARVQEEASYTRQRQIAAAKPDFGTPPEDFEEWKAHHARVQEWRDASGLDAEEEVAGHWCGVVDDFAQQIAAISATTIAGLRVKARLIRFYKEIQVQPVGGLTDGFAQDVLALTAAAAKQIGGEAIDWHNPPAGFMAHPAIEPQGFLAMRYGLRAELDRLHQLALAELKRLQPRIYSGLSETEAQHAEERLRAELFIAPLTAAVDIDSAEAIALATLREAREAPLSSDSDPILSAIAEARAAQAAMDAWNNEVNISGLDACGGFDRENTLSKRQSDTARAVFRMTPVTAEGRRALVTFAAWQVDLYGTTDGSPQDGEDTVFQWAYEALARAVTAERTAALPEDLSTLSMAELAGLYEAFDAASDCWLDLTHLPWSNAGQRDFFFEPSAAGKVVDAEQTRAARTRDRIAGEIGNRSPTNRRDRDQQLETLVRYELLCNGDLRDPDIRARIAETWGA